MFGRRSFSEGPGSRGPFFRGVFNYIILQYLKDRPKHGYEIIRELEEHFHGLYAPSAGTIYPRLQSLEKRGLVTSVEMDTKRVYSITDAGLCYLTEHHEILAKTRDRLNELANPESEKEVLTALLEFRTLARTVKWEFGKLDADKLARITQALSRANQEIDEILKG
ncbi:MAG: PadR family transcriptional regulator [Chloroflexi bacterium]|nr:PadR family transcriptional regulator [Chloroflexota bacterium]